jgi:hypothetical protein
METVKSADGTLIAYSRCGMYLRADLAALKVVPTPRVPERQVPARRPACRHTPRPCTRSEYFPARTPRPSAENVGPPAQP